MGSKLLHQPHTVPMEILVLGLSRTGTMSMKFALQDLGYNNVYHMTETFSQPGHPEQWIRALNAKFSPSTCPPFTKEDWDSLLGSYSAVTDLPSACFTSELLTHYPTAKIILTTRPTHLWHTSILSTIHALHSSPLDRFFLLFRSKHTKSLSKLWSLIVQYYFKGNIVLHGKEVFEEHNQMVRDLAKKGEREFLEFRVGEDSWDALCTFLNKPVPDTEFPHVNDRESWREAFRLDFPRFPLTWDDVSRVYAVGMIAMVFGLIFTFLVGVAYNGNRLVFE